MYSNIHCIDTYLFEEPVLELGERLALAPAAGLLELRGRDPDVLHVAPQHKVHLEYM